MMRYEPARLPMAYMVTLSTILLFFAVLLYVDAPLPPSDAPVFMTLREQSGHHFSHDRLARAPILYGALHAVPGSLWCLTIPFQHVKAARQRWPGLHRWSGRLAVLSSFILSVTGLLLRPYELSYTAPTFHIHELRLGSGPSPVTVMAWPSFDLALYFLAPALMYSAYKTIALARAKRFAEHRRYAMICTAIGYIVPLQRVPMLLLPLLSFGLSCLTDEQRAFLRVPTSLPAKAEAEKAAFALTVWGASAVAGTYVMQNGGWHNVKGE